MRIPCVVGAASASASAESNVVAEMAFEMRTPQIVASGKFSTKSAWMFYRKGNKSLLGDIVMAHLVEVPKGTTKLDLLCRIRAAVPNQIPFMGAPLRPSEWTRRELILRYGNVRGLVSLRALTESAVADPETPKPPRCWRSGSPQSRAPSALARASASLKWF